MQVSRAPGCIIHAGMKFNLNSYPIADTSKVAAIWDSLPVILEKEDGWQPLRMSEFGFLDI